MIIKSMMMVRCAENNQEGEKDEYNIRIVVLMMKVV